MKAMIYFFLLLSHFLLVFCDPESCHNFFKNTSNLNSLLPSSAHRQFELGFYDKCTKDPQTHFLVLYTPNALLQLTTGICLPNFCTSFDMNAIVIPYDLYPIIPFLNPTTTIAVDPKDYEASLGTGGIVVLVILSILAFMSLLGPIYTVFKGVKKGFSEMQKPLLENGMLGKEERSEDNLCEAVITAFSLENNLKKVFTIREGKLDFFNCLRALSLFYVIFGHEFLLRVNQSMNPLEIVEFLKKPIFLLAAGGFYAVDVFYYLSGFFLAFVLIQGNLKYFFGKKADFFNIFKGI